MSQFSRCVALMLNEDSKRLPGLKIWMPGTRVTAWAQLDSNGVPVGPLGPTPLSRKPRRAFEKRFRCRKYELMSGKNMVKWSRTLIGGTSFFCPSCLFTKGYNRILIQL